MKNESMPKIKSRSIKVISFRDTLLEAERIECDKLGIPLFEPCTDKTLPDGSPAVFMRLWDLISERHYGSQKFTNESLYRFVFKSFNGDEMSSDEQQLYDICNAAGAVEDEQVIFDVSW